MSWAPPRGPETGGGREVPAPSVVRRPDLKPRDNVLTSPPARTFPPPVGGRDRTLKTPRP